MILLLLPVALSIHVYALALLISLLPFHFSADEQLPKSLLNLILFSCLLMLALQVQLSDKGMETRKTSLENAPKLYPDFGITKLLEKFPAPPCQPPRGLDVLERFFALRIAQPKNRQDNKNVAWLVATELSELWKVGDGRIPRKSVSHLMKQIVEFRELLAFLCVKSRAGRGSYQSKVW